jgi:hypothetical protein
MDDKVKDGLVLSVIWSYYNRIDFGWRHPSFTEVGVQVGHLGYSLAGRSAERPPRLMLNGGGHLNMTTSVNHPLTKAFGL